MDSTDDTANCTGTVDALAMMLTGAADAVWRAGLKGDTEVSPAPVRRVVGAFPRNADTNAADAAADRFLAATYASEGRRPLLRGGSKP